MAYLDVTVDGELTGGQSTNHEKTGAETSIAATDTKLLTDLDQSAGGSLTRETLGLVDLGKHGVSGLRDNGGGETSDETRSQVDSGLCSIRGSVLVDNGLVDCFGSLLVDNELGHGVRNLLEQDGAETTVESTDTFILENLAETANKAGGEGGLGNKTDTGGFEGAQGNVGEEFGSGSRGKVDGGSVVGSSLITEQVDGLLLEELVTSELEGSLQEITGECRAKAS